MARAWAWPELPMLVALWALASLTWVFIELAGAVGSGSTQAFDEWVVDALRNRQDGGLPGGPRWLVEAGRDLTALGSVTVLTLSTAATTGYLLLAGKRRSAMLMLLAVLSGLAVEGMLKHHWKRERPAAGSELTLATSYSFPSGHSMLSAIVYPVLGTMLARAERRRRIKIYCLAVALVFSGLVGLSRVYLGVHYPTDVLGGWAAGLAWALLWWFIARALDWRAMRCGRGDRCGECPSVAGLCEPGGAATAG